MADLKWADVAHYYAYSNVYGHLNWSIASIFREPLENPQFAELTIDRIKPLRMQEISFVPILRHLEDMTEADAMSLWKSVANRVEFSDSVYGAHGSPLVIYRSKFKAWYPEEFHCAIRLGFDMYKLIESGQAIRKEVGNG